MIDLSLTCPTCGRRADMCFDHGDEWKQRRIRMDLTGGATMDVNVSPDVSPETLAALRNIGEAAARRLAAEPCSRCKGTRVVPAPGPEWFIPCPKCAA